MFEFKGIKTQFQPYGGTGSSGFTADDLSAYQRTRCMLREYNERCPREESQRRSHEQLAERLEGEIETTTR